MPLKAPLKDFPGVVGPTYTGLAPAIDGELCMNLITEKAQGNSKAPIYYVNTPGFSSTLETLGTGAGLGGVSINGRRFFIASSQFWEIGGSSLNALTPISRGFLPVPMAPYWQFAVNTRGQQILMAGGGEPYLFDLSTNTFGPVSTPEPLSIIDESDGYFIGLSSTGSGNFYISNYGDGTIWNALNFAFEQSPDLTTSFKVSHRILWMFGDNHCEPYVDTGNANFPFQPDQSTYINSGIIAPYSLCIADNTLFYLGSSDGGANVLYRLNGATPTRVSTHAFETALSDTANYPTTADAYFYRYLENGHEFVMMHFPSGNATWAYDCSTQMLTQRGLYNQATGTYDIAFDRYHVWDPVLNAHLVQDYRNSNLYARSASAYYNGGNMTRWCRRFPHFNSDQVSWDYHKLRLIMQTGVNGSLAPDYCPSVQLRRSFDGGYTFQPSIINGSVGQTGNYVKHVDFDDLGNARDMVFEWSSADAVAPVLLAAKLSATPCLS
jgi:hypothetical protein